MARVRSQPSKTAKGGARRPRSPRKPKPGLHGPPGGIAQNIYHRGTEDHRVVLWRGPSHVSQDSWRICLNVNPRWKVFVDGPSG